MSVYLRCIKGFPALLFLMAIVLSSAVLAESEDGSAAEVGEQPVVTAFGGPNTAEGLLADAAEERKPIMRIPAIDSALQPWFDFKKMVDEEIGLQFGVNYSATYQKASETLPDAEDEAAVGIFRYYSKWKLVNRDGPNTGSLVATVDNRHKLGTDIAPADLGFEAGYLGIPGTLFSDAGWLLVELSWQQYFNDGKSGLIFGRYDPNDYLGVLGYANPWTTVQNLATLLNTSIALPDASIGLGLGHHFERGWYLNVTANDANGTVTDVDWFADGGEFYKQAEIGWSPDRGKRFTHNIHVTGWHVDKRENAGVPESWGFTTGANWTWNKNFMPFFRAGWSDGEAPLMNTSVTGGVMYKFLSRSDLTGVAVNWGEPLDSALRNQWTTEVFYQIQVAQNLEITPHVQILGRPANNPEEDTITILGIRGRLTL